MYRRIQETSIYPTVGESKQLANTKKQSSDTYYVHIMTERDGDKRPITTIRRSRSSMNTTPMDCHKQTYKIITHEKKSTTDVVSDDSSYVSPTLSAAVSSTATSLTSSSLTSSSSTSPSTSPQSPPTSISGSTTSPSTISPPQSPLQMSRSPTQSPTQLYNIDEKNIKSYMGQTITFSPINEREYLMKSFAEKSYIYDFLDNVDSDIDEIFSMELSANSAELDSMYHERDDQFTTMANNYDQVHNGFCM